MHKVSKILLILSAFFCVFCGQVSGAPGHQLTLDVSKAHQDQALTLLQGHAAEVECLIRHKDDDTYRDLKGYTGYFYYGASSTATAWVTVSSTNVNRGHGSITFSFTEQNLNTNGAWLAYITLMDASSNDYWAGTIDLTLEENTISGASALVLKGINDGSSLTGIVAGTTLTGERAAWDWLIYADASTNYYARANDDDAPTYTNTSFSGIIASVQDGSIRGTTVALGSRDVDGTDIPFLIDSQINITNEIHFMGLGNPYTLCRVSGNPSNHCFYIQPTRDNPSKLNLGRFSNIRFEGSDTNCHALTWDHANEWQVDNCEFTSFGLSPIYINTERPGAIWNRFYDNYFVCHGSAYAIEVDTTNSGAVADLMIQRNMFNGRVLQVTSNANVSSVVFSGNRMLGQGYRSTLKLDAGRGYLIADNIWVDTDNTETPIQFGPRPTSTNVEALIIGNLFPEHNHDNGFEAFVDIGDNVDGVFMIGNYTAGATNVYTDTDGSNVSGLSINYTGGNMVADGGVQVATEVYDSTGWNADLTVPTKDAVRDKLEAFLPMLYDDEGDPAFNITGGYSGDDLVVQIGAVGYGPGTYINIDNNGNLTAPGTVSAEDLTASDDLNVTDDATIGGDLTVGGSILGQSIKTWMLATGIFHQVTATNLDVITSLDLPADVIQDVDLDWASMTYLGEEGQPTAAGVGLASANLDDSDASIEWEDATDLDADGSVSANSVTLGADTVGSYAAGDGEAGGATQLASFVNIPGTASAVTGGYLAVGSTFTLSDADGVGGDLIVSDELEVDGKAYFKDTIAIDSIVYYTPKRYVIATNRIWTAAELCNAKVLVTAVSTQTMPAVSTWPTNLQYYADEPVFLADGAVEFVIDVNAADQVRLDGAAWDTAGDGIVSGGDAGDMAIMTPRDQDGWYAATSGFTSQ